MRPVETAPASGALELSFLPGDPPRAGRFLLWSWTGPAPTDQAPTAAGRPLPVDLVLPRGATGRSLGVRAVDATPVPVADAIDWLALLPVDPTPSPSVVAWSKVVRAALAVLARGRLVPGMSLDGFDAWRLGPLDPEDEAVFDALADALPPPAFAVLVGPADAWVRKGANSAPLRTQGGQPAAGRAGHQVLDPRWLVRAAADAVADAFVRTASAPVVASSSAYATTRPVDVSRTPDWLAAVDRSLTAGARPVLRLELPLDDDFETELAAGVDALDLGIRASLLLRSNADPSLLVEAEQLWDAPEAVLERLGEDAETDLLLALRRGATVWPPLGRALDDRRPTGVDLTPDEADELLGPVAAELAAAGFEVLWPADLLRSTLTLAARATTPTPDAVAGAGIDLQSLLDFRWHAQLDGADLTEAELAVLAEAKRPLVRLRGRWVAADPALLARLRERRRVRAGDLLASAMGGQVVVDGTPVPLEVEGPVAVLAQRLASLDGARERPEPAGLLATLRPYQRRGLAWLAEMADLGLGGCLADDMGLGKTVQLIALHLHRHRRGVRKADRRPTLVVCPATLLGNWEREVAKFAPSIPVRRYHGGGRTLGSVAGDEIVVATYGMVRRDRAELATVDWGLVVADEAQHVKNPLARTARELRLIPAQARIALTGTPVENRLSELWALLDWTTPGLLGSLEDFRQRVAIPVERERDPEATERFAQLVRPFLLRRRKADPEIAPDLPPKTEVDVLVPLTAEQLSLYESCARETLELIESSEGIQRQGLIFKLFTGLKQITNHPAQYLKEEGPIDGRSGKLAAFDEIVDVIVAEGESVLVFTQYVEMGRLLERHLAARHVPSLFLHGRVAVRKRQDQVDAFQAGAVPVMILSLKAGGTGLNLTRATHVIHYDRWWNPAVEDQATDRAYRIGQDRPVTVHRLLSEGTVEDRIAALIARKRELADAVVGEGEAWLSQLSDGELRDLVGFGAAPLPSEADREVRRGRRSGRGAEA